jgi:hypothetical protein
VGKEGITNSKNHLITTILEISKDSTSGVLKVKWKRSTGIFWSQCFDKRRTALAEANLKWALSTELYDKKKKMHKELQT